MIDYTELKHMDNGMPTREGLMYPILKVAEEKEIWTRSELTKAVIKEINLPKELVELKYSSKYHDSVIESLIGFSLSEDIVSGMLERPTRAHYSITELGKQMSHKYGVNLTSDIVHSLPKYAKYQQAKQHKQGNSESEYIEVDQTKLNQTEIESWFNDQTEILKHQLMEQLMRMDPYRFEFLMVTLLSRMGYKGPNGQSIVTQKSNDNGIDGIIYQDPLGLQKVFVQVKRYETSNSVGRPEIISFSGAIKLKHTDRGVFITTSTFTSGAIEAANSLNITTINGDMLANLMIQYRVGIETVKNYQLFRIDKDMFSGD